MSKNNFSSLPHKEQAKIKPKPPIEDVISELFEEGEKKQALLNFVEHLRKNNMNPVWTLHNKWKANNKGKTIFYLGLNANSWDIDLFLHNRDSYDDAIINEGLQYVFWDRIVFWPNPIHDCAGYRNKRCLAGKDVTIYGKEYKNICGCMSKFIRNPSNKTIEGIQRLLELEKQARAKNQISQDEF